MKRLLQTLLAMPLLLMLAACHAPMDQNTAAPAFELRLYQVPVAHSDAIARQLTKVLVDSRFQSGLESHTEMNVSQPFPGTVLVLAPSTLQPSIAKAIDALKEVAKDAPDESVSSAKSEPPPLQVRLWVIQIRAGAGTDSHALAELEPTLEELRQPLGTTHLVMDDFVSVVTYGHDGIATTSQGRAIKFDPWSTPTGTVLEIDYKDLQARNFRGLHTSFPVRPGEYVAVAQAAGVPGPDASKGDGAVLMNLLVVRADPLQASP